VPVPVPEERGADCPAEAGVAVWVNSPDPADPPEELDPPPPAPPPLEAARALGALREEEEEEEEEIDEDVLRAKAASGPNSRLALPADVNASVDVGRPDTAPAGCAAPGTAPVSR